MWKPKSENMTSMVMVIGYGYMIYSTIEFTFILSHPGFWDGVTGQCVKPRDSGWKLRGGSWRQRWRRSRRSWGWRREVCCGVEPPTGPAPLALLPLPPRLWAQDQPQRRPSAQTLKLPVQSKGHTERGEGWVTYLPSPEQSLSRLSHCLL